MLGLHGGSCRVERNLFDRALFEHAEQAGAKGFTRSKITSLEMDEGNWNFDLQSERDTMKGRARWVVAATGRNRRAPGTRSQYRHWLDRLIAISMISNCDPPANLSQSAIHLQVASGGWWYSVTTPSGRIVVVFFTDSDLLPRGKRTQSDFMFTQLSEVALPAPATKAAATCLEGCRWIGFGARSGIRNIGMSKNWIAVGDALAAHDPLCGKGITYALGSGIETADLLLESGSDVGTGRRSRWADRVMRNFNAYAVERLANYGLERRFATSTFWQRRCGRD
jgi:flavin-dependent dehydrogenase